jgi:hypothetical protein
MKHLKIHATEGGNDPALPGCRCRWSFPPSVAKQTVTVRRADQPRTNEVQEEYQR